MSENPTPPSFSSPWMTPSQASSYTHLGERTLRQHVADGSLVCHRQGRITRYHVEDLDAFLRAGRVSGTHAA